MKSNKKKSATASKIVESSQLKSALRAVPPPETPSICKSAMLARLSISSWTARKYDKKVSDDVANVNGADKDAGRYNKHLFGGSKAAAAHSELLAEVGAARKTHELHTLPWDDSGYRLLPTGVYLDYVQFLGEMRQRFDNAVEAFMADYPNLRMAARARLGALYNDQDYPSEDEVRRRFSMRIDYMPIPKDGDFRLGLAGEDIEKIEAATREKVESAAKTAITNLWERMYDVVSKAKDRLADKDAIFRDSLILNVVETVDLVKQLNFVDSPEIEVMRKRIEKEIAEVHPDDLRENADLRKQTAQKAQQIIDAMSAFYGGAK